ncbi:2-isopropylmalate synthase [Buchnera aphidicola]|uniref:2-isopropylmalate synthase n=1 Tax=Buchnera aphidicola subsp. Cinara cedri (strain Cc) TaxID=372461 RepID=LEU1_BUCCC|nr:2-isopropylmalate synthase [Buchnera aphidicola]Q5WQ01.1 RecName: Full=2-isopropylmalate synthase; AltName: Full=Alpha-IPM synthase; AltName: Full=Alpha-isopropylmalate synthase [Buchnera aphidicola BCc]AAR99732.1 2-isopropylmalate synthase [Buchnera aphidicola BCc]
MNEKIIIFDTTLRDGEQALLTSLTSNEKIQIALALERLGVDVIEVGFPVSSPGDFKSVQMLSKIIKNSKICSLARCLPNDITIAADAMQFSKNFRIHLFLGTSDLHVSSKLKKNFNEIIEMAVASVKQAKKFTNDIEFSCEDAGRTTLQNLYCIIEAVIKAGATTVNIPDTVGYTTPTQFKKIITMLFNHVKNIHQAIISVHCHNDLGMAVANSISAVEAGVRQIEGTMNGLGERAGNAALEEVIMTLNVHKNSLKVSTDINIKEIHRTSKIVSQFCNTPIPLNKAIIGKNVFSHSSGIHQDGVLKNRKNYEIIDPNSIGFTDYCSLNLTSRSGRAAVKHHMKKMGYENSDYNLNELYIDFLKLADKKGRIFDYDLEALAFFKKQQNTEEYYKLEYFDVQSKLSGLSTAYIVLICGSQTNIQKATTYNGPVDAIYQALNKATLYSIVLKKFHLEANGEGKDALGKVNIIVQYKLRNFHGVGLATDIIEASAQAMVNVLNYIWKSQQVNKELERLQK